MTVRTIAIIPVRGGSAGIPRKNARLLAGKPLLAYTIEAALKAQSIDSVIVSTDDNELAEVARRYGATVLDRPERLATGRITLDEVVLHATELLSERGEHFDYVVTIQATSPLLQPRTIDAVVSECIAGSFDTCLTVSNQSHLSWGVNDEGVLQPLYEKRVNRQELPVRYVETGGVVVCRKETLQSGTRFGKSVQAVEISQSEAIDIDGYFDWWLAEKCLQRVRICFHVIGNRGNGLGHVHRALTLADRLTDHEVCFLVNRENDLAIELIRQRKHELVCVEPGEELDWILSHQPEVVINDILDTSDEYMKPLRDADISTINFEDVGKGSGLADCVINAMFDEFPIAPPRSLYQGVRYCVLRDEFYSVSPISVRPDVQNVLILAGGTDPSDLIYTATQWLVDVPGDWKLTIILGLGYPAPDRLEKECRKLGRTYELVRSTNVVSRYMEAADVAISSGGRTVFELASLGVPMIVIPQNDREQSHKFAMSSPTVITLPQRDRLTKEMFSKAVEELVNGYHLRAALHQSLLEVDIPSGTERVLSIIRDICTRRK